jgi:hypothetical protein
MHDLGVLEEQIKSAEKHVSVASPQTLGIDGNVPRHLRPI